MNARKPGGPNRGTAQGSGSRAQAGPQSHSLGMMGHKAGGSSVPSAHVGSHGHISSIQSDSGNKFLQLVWQGQKSRLKLCVSNSKIIIENIPLTLNFKGIQNMKIHHYIVW